MFFLIFFILEKKILIFFYLKICGKNLNIFLIFLMFFLKKLFKKNLNIFQFFKLWEKKSEYFSDFFV